MTTPDEVEAGHAFYTRRTLAIYDPMILGYFSRLAWRCPAKRILEHYDQHVSSNHLDGWPGTGYFLDRAHFDSSSPRIVLMDLNDACLEAAGRRIARHRPEVVRANALEQIPYDGPPFYSIGLNYLLHCIPGGSREKGPAVLGSVKAVAAPGATVFGATLLHDGVPRNFMARQVMARNNRHGIFSNEDDDLDGLREVLEEHLKDPTLDVVGCVGIFAGRA